MKPTRARVGGNGKWKVYTVLHDAYGHVKFELVKSRIPERPKAKHIARVENRRQPAPH